MVSKSRLNQLSISLGLGLTLTLVASLNSATFAQSRSDNEGYQSNEKSTFFGETSGDLDPIDLMHRAQQSNRRSALEFDEESQGQLNNSASDFKRLQQQRILEQQQQQKPVVTPAEATETTEVSE
ncbi:hypothetical protein [Pleurocapsa sp. PCC 7319]|uniref:hypothetical protein n=1 Tax=Pleurocapsa sp. PCC 7319 TaxID=118161 RepID=UPI000349AD8B|nr:hypothetical protein [Pleurocapsa sp. PCC 7319]